MYVRVANPQVVPCIAITNMNLMKTIEVIEEIRKELKIVPGFVQGILDENREKCAQLAKNLFDKHSIFLLGKR